MLSRFYAGEQMIEIFNRLNVRVSCLGNHDMDYGLEKMEQLILKTNSVWLMANLYYGGKIVGNLARSHIVFHEGLKIGIFGLCEFEWLGILDPLIIDKNVEYVDFVTTAHEMSNQLKSEGCLYIIALTHMRLQNDRILAEAC